MTDPQPTAKQRISAVLATWPGVTTASHRFGGIEFRLGRRELGHLHGNHLADIPLPRWIRDQLIAEGRAQPHHILPDSGWISVPISQLADAEDVTDLLRLSYDRAQQALMARQSRQTR